MAFIATGLFWCGNQWGYTPVGTVANIPPGFCNPPTDLKAEVYAQFATLSWKAPHDYLKFVLEYRIGVGIWTTVDVVGQSYKLNLTPETEYQWRVKTVCELAPLRESIYANGQNFTTGLAVASCAAVSAVTVTYMGTFYRLSWLTTGAQYYTVEVRLVGSSTTRTYGTQALQLDLTDLVEGSTYEARVIAHCENIYETPEPSPWVQWTVASLTCPKPGALTFTKTSTTILVGWGSAGVGYTYNIYLNGVLKATGYPLTTFTFAGLTPSTEYTIEVRTNCGNGYSEVQTLVVVTSPAACNPPTGLTVSAQTPTGFTIDWTPGAGIVSQQVILNNGDPIALGAAIATYSFTNLPGGSINNVVVRSICAASVSIDVGTQVTLDGCAAPTGLSLTPSYNSIAISWNNVANALRYRVVVTKVVGAVVVYDQTVTTNTFNATGLLPATNYSVDVYSECGTFGGTFSSPVTDSDTTAALPNCESAQIDSQVLGQNSLDITFSFASGRTTGFITAKLLKASDDSLIDTQTFTSIGTVSFTGLLPATGYKVFIYHEDQPGLNQCTPVLIATLTTTALCEPPSNVVATNITNDTEIQVTATASPSAPPTYQLEYQLNGSSTWISVGAVTLPYTITPVEPGMYRVRLRSNCPASVSAWVESDYTCPKPILTQAAVSGNSVTIGWQPLLGVTLYKVEVNSAVSGISTYNSSTNSITITGLAWNSVFTAKITAVCDIEGDTGIDSDPFSFATGDQSTNTLCGNPVFSSLTQPCDVTDPGGGEEQSCVVTPTDWDVNSSIFLSITNDPPNDTYMEAVFQITNNLPNGDTGPFPGGVLGIIKSVQCHPLTSTIMDLEILSGGTIGVATATLATNGNVTISGSFTSDGNTVLTVRVRGNYNKV